MENIDRTLTVFDENGNQKDMYILFTTTLEEYPGKNYIFFTDLEDEEKQVFIYDIKDDGSLNPVTDEAEWEILEEVFTSYVQNHENDFESGCGGCGGCSGCNEDCDGNCDCDGSCDCQNKN